MQPAAYHRQCAGRQNREFILALRAILGENADQTAATVRYMGSEDRAIDGLVIRTLEKLVARFSLVGDSEFFDPSHFPWVNEVEANWRGERRIG